MEATLERSVRASLKGWHWNKALKCKKESAIQIAGSRISYIIYGAQCKGLFIKNIIKKFKIVTAEHEATCGTFMKGRGALCDCLGHLPMKQASFV